MKIKKQNLMILGQSFGKVFSHPLYIALAVIVGGFLLALAIWLPNLHLITQTLHSDVLTIAQKTNITVSFLGALETNFTTLSRNITIIISVLAGINIAFLVYYLRTRLSLEREAGASIGGMILGLLGVGCASCGSVIFSTIFGLSAAAGFLGILPLKGQEFGLAGVVLLLWSIYLTSQKINKPLSCQVTIKD